MNNALEQFKKEKDARISQNKDNAALTNLSMQWMTEAAQCKYSYNFTWLGIPIIQYPPDIVALQEIIWKTKPDVIIETGVAHGGSLIFYASMMKLLNKGGKVIGIDIDIRSHNRQAIEAHPLANDITLIEGSSIDKNIVSHVFDLVKNNTNILLCLDSSHSYNHVLEELFAYSSLVKKGNYIIVFDTMIENMPNDMFSHRGWNKLNNPKIAVHEFLEKNNRFKIDFTIENKLQITVSPHGYLECIAN